MGKGTMLSSMVDRLRLARIPSPSPCLFVYESGIVVVVAT